ncbi:unnamed protein product [Rhizoctonia solani]|uniref:Zn(2)-C6 fungal-type domain-containing protein n=1 Tax=Rhizoctonia solani TaxID=456999 RepID=A0A8H3AXY7_9AGAM|nr:unnamed protein product [Rhizoctonia solani]
MLNSSGSGCSNCQYRRKKCDETRPACRRCKAAGLECAGYSDPVSLRHSVPDSRPRHLRAVSRDMVASSTSSHGMTPNTSDTLTYTDTYGMNSRTSFHRTISTASKSNPTRSNLDGGIAHLAVLPPLFSDHWSDAPFFGSTHARIEEITGTSGSPIPRAFQHSVRQEPTPHELLDLPDKSVTWSSAPLPSQNPAYKSMSSGQASLYDALFSLARPGEDYYNPSGSISGLSRNLEESLSTPLTEQDGESRSPFVSDDVDDIVNDAEDPEGIKAIMVRPLPLDRNVESNTLPFLLESYAIWISRMIFDPLRVARVGREYVFRKYGLGETTRLRMLLVSRFARAVARSTEYDVNNLPSLVLFREHMSQSYRNALAICNSSRELDVRTATSAFDHSYELISISCKLLPLSSVLAIMQAGAPIFRRACPDPPRELVHLPSILLNIDVSLRYYATMDVLFSVITNRPMFFRYNVAFTPEITESMLYIENHLGLQWLYGVPDRLVVTLARMNALREDFGLCVEEKYIRELEAEIASFRVVLGFSGDPTLTVARMVVQECWRQAAYIYLYMGLGGANSEDARVKKAHKRFMQTFKESMPGRHPDVFLVFPMMILGIASRQLEDQDLIRRRMLNLPDCARRETFGNETNNLVRPSARLFGRDGVFKKTNPQQIALRPFNRTPLGLQNISRHKTQPPEHLNQDPSDEHSRLGFKQGVAPKDWGGGFDAVITAVTGVVVIFFGGIAYVAWYKADVLDKIEEAFAPGYDPVLELMSYPSSSGEVDEDGVRNYALSTWQVKRKEQALVDSIMEGKEAGHYFLFLGPNGTGKTTMMVDAMRKVDADGVTICDAHPDLEVFRLRLGKALNYEYNEDSQTGLFQRRDPREGGPRLDIERAMNKLEKVAIRRARKTGRPIVLIINDIHLFNNDDDGRLLLQQLQQRAESWAESGKYRDNGVLQVRPDANCLRIYPVLTIIIHSDDFWPYSVMRQIANRMQIFSVKDLEPFEAFKALKKLRQESLGREEVESDHVLARAAKTSGGRLAHLNRLARSRDINHTTQNLKNNEKSWLLSNFGLIPDCDDDVEEEAKWASCTWLLLREFVRRRAAMEEKLKLGGSKTGEPATIDHVPVPSIPYYECRRIMTRGDFLARLDQMNIISIDVHHQVQLDSMLTLEAAREVVSEPDFEPMLKGVLARVDELESLGRTRELTFKDVKTGDRVEIVIDKTGGVNK